MEKLIQTIVAFRNERNWSQFHTERNLAISISVEAAELLEIFQWGTSCELIKQKKNEIEEEIADILIYCLLLCDRLGVNPDSIVKAKIEKNRLKYPIEKAFNSSKKYDEL